ncbi:MAG: hypothetical protein J7K83_00775 [Candidatus Aenigmarchaeota archaeon]|nr:hypothetical protein [Candidatus Aenigmarchaeota archaeon]
MVNREQAEKIFLSLILVAAILLIVFYFQSNKSMISNGMVALNPMLNTWILVAGVFMISMIVWMTKQ